MADRFFDKYYEREQSAILHILDKEISLIYNYKLWFTDFFYHKATGSVSVPILDKEYDVKTKIERWCRTSAIKSMVSDGIIKPASKMHGQYTLVTKDVVEMDFMNSSGQSIDLWLPFNIHKMVDIYPGNIIQVNGQKNAGKTAFVLNTIKGNMNIHNVFYFNSEMGSNELKRRLQNDNHMSLSSWKFKAFERSSDFADVVIPGEGNLNIIDFLEVHDEFWMIGKYMRDIHDALKGAIAIVCIQLNPGSEFGLGGARTEEKPRLILNMTPGKVKVKMAKNWKTDSNPNGLCVNFKLAKGIFFRQEGEWFFEEKK